MSKKYASKEFFKALHSKEGLPNIKTPLALDGLVKPGDRPGSMLFSPGSKCGNWVDVPEEAVESIDHYGKRKCKEHEHDYVRIHFKTPDNPVANTYANLLTHHLSTSNLNTFLDFCSISCRAVFGLTYDNLKAGLELARRTGVITNLERCHQLAEPGADLAGALATAGFDSALIGLIVRTMTKDCIRCCCEEVF